MKFSGFYGETDHELTKLRDHFLNLGVPVIKEDANCALQMFLRIKRPKKILEIGTAAGLSGCTMLKSCDGDLLTIENNQKMCDVARENFLHFGFENRVQVLCGDAAKLLEELVASKKSFDFIFLDGPKAQYKNYLQNLVTLTEKNGIIVADNVLFRGLVEENGEIEKKYRGLVRSIRQFLQLLKNRDDLVTTVLNIGDGISVSIKK